MTLFWAVLSSESTKLPLGQSRRQMPLPDHQRPHFPLGRPRRHPDRERAGALYYGVRYHPVDAHGGRL